MTIYCTATFDIEKTLSMITRKSFVALGLVIGLVTGCGGDNFNGSYLTNPSRTGTPAMNVDGDRALFVLIDSQTSEFKEVIKFDVSYKDQKMFLDVQSGGPRFVYTRSVDERGLECLNCEDFGRTMMPTKWASASKHLDLEAALKEQEEIEKARWEEEEKAFLKRQEENAKAEKKAKADAEAKYEAALARLEDEAKKLGPFEGTWVVVQQPGRLSGLTTWTIDRDSGLVQRFYGEIYSEGFLDYKILFEVTDGELVRVIPRQENKRYTLNAEGNQLRCNTCNREDVWLKLDPNKVNDISHIEQLATQLIKR